MKNYLKIYCIACSCLIGTFLFSMDKDYCIRFRSGKILAAELIPGEAILGHIKNINKYEASSRITSDVGYAVIVISLDPGRGLSIYDYSLKDSHEKNFPCVAIKNKDGDFDATEWLYENAPQTNRYTLLFRVQLPPPSKPSRYDLIFNLLKNQDDIVSIPFVKLKDKPFTNQSLFPDSGIVQASSEEIKDFYAEIYHTTQKTTEQAPEAKPEVKPEAKPEVKPEVKPEEKPAKKAE